MSCGGWVSCSSYILPLPHRCATRRRAVRPGPRLVLAGMGPRDFMVTEHDAARILPLPRHCAACGAAEYFLFPKGL
eukprot:56194-Chlamydomonas_euryale.AAC.2